MKGHSSEEQSSNGDSKTLEGATRTFRFKRAQHCTHEMNGAVQARDILLQTSFFKNEGRLDSNSAKNDCVAQGVDD